MEHKPCPDVSATLDTETGTVSVMVACPACQPFQFHFDHLSVIQAVLTDLLKQYGLLPAEVDLLNVEGYDPQ